ncbi:hypothetical protein ACLKA6_008587 [Drosophila palustris]
MLAGLSTGTRTESQNRGVSEGSPYPTQESGVNVDLRRACRNCAQVGHFSRECQNPRTLFCWDCGRRGIPLWIAVGSGRRETKRAPIRPGNGWRQRRPRPDSSGTTAL